MEQWKIEFVKFHQHSNKWEMFCFASLLQQQKRTNWSIKSTNGHVTQPSLQMMRCHVAWEAVHVIIWRNIMEIMKTYDEEAAVPTEDY